MNIYINSFICLLLSSSLLFSTGQWTSVVCVLECLTDITRIRWSLLKSFTDQFKRFNTNQDGIVDVSYEQVNTHTHACMHTLMHACTHAQTHAYTHTHTHTHTLTHYVCISTHYVCISTHYVYLWISISIPLSVSYTLSLCLFCSQSTGQSKQSQVNHSQISS